MLAASKSRVLLTLLLRTNASVSTEMVRLLVGIYLKRRGSLLTVQACRSTVF